MTKETTASPGDNPTPLVGPDSILFSHFAPTGILKSSNNQFLLLLEYKKGENETEELGSLWDCVPGATAPTPKELKVI